MRTLRKLEEGLYKNISQHHIRLQLRQKKLSERKRRKKSNWKDSLSHIFNNFTLRRSVQVFGKIKAITFHKSTHSNDQSLHAQWLLLEFVHLLEKLIWLTFVAKHKQDQLFYK